jgi:hypothetical protein
MCAPQTVVTLTNFFEFETKKKIKEVEAAMKQAVSKHEEFARPVLPSEGSGTIVQ